MGLNRIFLTKRGFSLVELMLVVFIIGILVAIAYPNYQKSQQKAADNAHDYNKRIIIGAVMSYIAENDIPENGGEPEEGWQDALVGKYLQDWPDPPPGYSGVYKVINSFADYMVILE